MGNLDSLGGFNGYSFNSEDIQKNKKKINFFNRWNWEETGERGIFWYWYSYRRDTGHFDTGHLLSGFTPRLTLSFLQSPTTTNPVYFTSQVPSV